MAIEFDNTEGIFYDTARPIAGEEGQCPDRGQLYEEATESDICDRLTQLEAENRELREEVERLLKIKVAAVSASQRPEGGTLRRALRAYWESKPESTPPKPADEKTEEES